MPLLAAKHCFSLLSSILPQVVRFFCRVLMLERDGGLGTNLKCTLPKEAMLNEGFELRRVSLLLNLCQ